MKIKKEDWSNIRKGDFLVTNSGKNREVRKIDKATLTVYLAKIKSPLFGKGSLKPYTFLDSDMFAKIIKKRIDRGYFIRELGDHTYLVYMNDFETEILMKAFNSNIKFKKNEKCSADSACRLKSHNKKEVCYLHNFIEEKGGQ